MHTKYISPIIHNTGVRIVNRPDLENVRRLDLLPMPMIAGMQRWGMRVDRSLLTALHAQLTTEMRELENRIAELAGVRINVGSGDQLSNLIFNVLRDDKGHLLKQNGREKWTKSRKRLAADSDVLKAMVTQHACIRPILEWKEREKLRSTYTLSLAAKLDSEDRMHTDIGTTTAETGRLTSSNPNLQNIPIRTKLGREIRNAFIASRGLSIGSVDASQIEMRMMCHDAQCKAMMEIFWAYQDFYWSTAELMYKCEFPKSVRKCKCEDEGFKNDHKPGCPTVIVAPGKAFDGLTHKGWFRFNAKTTALMTAYDTSPGGLYDQFLITSPDAWQQDSQEEGERLCAKMITEYFTVYWEFLEKRKIHHKRAFRYMFVWDMWGRIRWIPQVRSVLRWVVNEGLRAAGNLAGQGGAAGIIKLWMYLVQLRVESYWRRHGIRVLMQVHDELVAEGPTKVLEEFLEECAHILRNLFVKSDLQDYFSVPLDAEWAVGDRWGDLKD